MEVSQIKNLVNQTTKEVLGETALQIDDLTDVVSLGESVYNVKQMDNYVRTLIDQIGKIVFVDRPYVGSVPSVLMDGWEYGAVLEKITMDSLPEAQENDSWKLTNGTSYDPNVFNGPKVSAKFFNTKSTFEIPMSFADKQVKTAFQNAGQLNAFMSMIENAITNSMTVKVDSLISSTINNMIAQTFHDGNANRCVNLLKQYNERFGTTLTAAKCITDPEFIRWASFRMGLYTNRLSKISKLFNIGGKERFTAGDKLHIVMLDEFARAADSYLQSDTYHETFTALPNAETVTYWQGSGTGYNFEDTSAIKVNVANPSGGDDIEINKTGILGVAFDGDALGVVCEDRRVTTQYNGRAEFYNNWYKFDAGYFNDLNENFVVFYVADEA